MVKKILSVVLAISLSIVLVLPASAEVTYNESLTKVDLLPSAGYQITVTDTVATESAFYDYSYNSGYPYFESVVADEWGIISYSDVSKVSFKWSPNVATMGKELYFYCYRASASVSVKINGSTQQTNVVGNNGGFYLYRTSFSGRNILDIEIIFDRGSYFTNTVMLFACFTYPVYSALLPRFDMAADFYISDYNDDLEEWVHFVDRKVDVPVELHQDEDYPYYFPAISYEHYWIQDFYDLDQVRIHLTFNMGDWASLPFLNQFRLSFASIGSTQISSCFLSNSSDEFDNNGIVLDDELWYGDFAAEGLKNVYKEYEANGYNVFVDLSGIDFTKYPFLHMELVVNPLQATFERDYYVYFEVFEAEYSYSYFTDLTDTILLNDLRDLILRVNLFNSDFQEFMQSQAGSFDSVLYSLEQIQDLLASSEAQKEQAADDKEVMQNQAGQIDELNQTMDSVSRENVNVSGLITNAVNFSPSALSFMSLITNNPYVYLILILVFTLALIGYVLFGKR